MRTCHSLLGIWWSRESLVMRLRVSRLRRTTLPTMLGTRSLCSIFLCRRLVRTSRKLCLANRVIKKMSNERLKSRNYRPSKILLNIAWPIHRNINHIATIHPKTLWRASHLLLTLRWSIQHLPLCELTLKESYLMLPELARGIGSKALHAKLVENSPFVHDSWSLRDELGSSHGLPVPVRGII
jgi:hypothetical protein